MKIFVRLCIIFLIISVICLPVYAKKSSKKSSKKAIEPQKVEYLAADKFQLNADLYLPPKLAKNTKIPLVILIHAIAQDKKVWKPYAIKMVEKGYSVLAVDLRGHGESILNRKNKKTYWRSFNKDDWEPINNDIVSAINYLKDNHPEVNTNEILIVGASMGTCLACVTAEKEKDKVKGLVLLSPFANYKNIEARVPLVNYGDHPILIAVSKTDTKSFEAASELVKYSQGEHEIVLVKNAGHGTFMLKFEPKLESIIFNWMDAKFPPTAIKVKADKKKGKKKSGKASHH